MGPFLRKYLSRFEGVDDDDDEMGHLYTGLSHTRLVARSMLEDWDVDHVAEENDNASAIPNQYLRRNRDHFSTPHTARDPNKIDEIELESEDLPGMICHPLKVGAVRFHHSPKSTGT